MLTIYGMSASGNCYKVRLLLSQLQREYRWEEIDVVGGATQEKWFLAMNSNGKVPLLQEEDRFLSESNAILQYLANGSPLWPADAWLQAQVLRWMFFEQYTHEPAIAVARFIAKFLPPDHPRRAELPSLRQRAAVALGVMDQHLVEHDFFSASYSIADIALFAYTHVASDAQIDLRKYPAVRAWLDRVAGEPGFLPLADFN